LSEFANYFVSVNKKILELFNEYLGKHGKVVSDINNIDLKLIDKQNSNCNTNNKISILEQKLDLIIKYINLQQDMKYKGLEDFSL